MIRDSVATVGLRCAKVISSILCRDGRAACGHEAVPCLHGVVIARGS
jgi:hypothetical protein